MPPAAGEGRWRSPTPRCETDVGGQRGPPVGAGPLAAPCRGGWGFRPHPFGRGGPHGPRGTPP
eukprot:5985818-Alexandrium_andersonii.AAC.1